MFNFVPMYWGTGGKVMNVNDDLSKVTIKIKHNYRTKNYVGAMFGGSLFSACDPIYMIQYNELLDNQYIVWDKSARIQFKRPAREEVWVDFMVEPEELEEIKQKVEENGTLTFTKQVKLTNKDKTVVFAILDKEIYIASKKHYNKRRKKK